MRSSILVTTLALASCLGPTTTVGDAPESIPADFPLLEGSWTVARLGSAVSEPGALTLTFDVDGSVMGSAGVNRFQGPFQTNGSSALTFGELATTKMAGAPEAMEFEALFLATLTEVDGFRMRADDVLLLSFGQPMITLTPLTGDAR